MRAGLSRETALESVTLAGARMLDLDDRIGERLLRDEGSRHLTIEALGRELAGLIDHRAETADRALLHDLAGAFELRSGIPEGQIPDTAGPDVVRAMSTARGLRSKP